MEKLLTEQISNYYTIYRVAIKGIDFYFREISKSELKVINLLQTSDLEKEEEICKMCVILPQGYDFTTGLAGISSFLTERIITLSGFTDNPEEVKNIQKKNEELTQQLSQDLDFITDCVILAAIPGIRLEELDNMPISSKMRYFLSAQFILINMHGVPPDVFRKILTPPKKIGTGRGTVTITDKEVMPQGFKVPRGYNPPPGV